MLQKNNLKGVVIIFNSKSKILCLSAVLGIIYTIYVITYFTGVNTGTTDTAESIGGAIATALVAPHMFLVALATIFNILAFFISSKGFAITAGVLFCVGGVLFLPYILFVVPMIVLSFVGVSRVAKIKASNNTLAQ